MASAAGRIRSSGSGMGGRELSTIGGGADISLRRMAPMVRMMPAAIRGMVDRIYIAMVKLLVEPTIQGPIAPPKLPIMLMKPTADAAAVALRSLRGMGQ